MSVDNYLNETTRHAHVILPGLSPLEQPHYDEMIWSWAIRSAGKYSPPLFEPEPDADRPHEWEILLKLAGIVQGKAAREVDPDAVDALFFAGIVATIAGVPSSPIHGRDPGEIVAATPGRGPERLLDFTIRTGPWGDAYGANPEGLTLEKLAAQPNGVDFGPLVPRLDEVLETPSGKLELAPEYSHVFPLAPRHVLLQVVEIHGDERVNLVVLLHHAVLRKPGMAGRRREEVGHRVCGGLDSGLDRAA